MQAYPDIEAEEEGRREEVGDRFVARKREARGRERKWPAPL